LDCNPVNSTEHLSTLAEEQFCEQRDIARGDIEGMPAERAIENDEAQPQRTFVVQRMVGADGSDGADSSGGA
jgi:hypothetical protein